MAADDPTNENMDLETFFSLNPDLLCVADSKGNFKKVNRAWGEFSGEYQILKPDRTVRWIRASLFLVKGDRNCTGYYRTERPGGETA